MKINNFILKKRHKIIQEGSWLDCEKRNNLATPHRKCNLGDILGQRNILAPDEGEEKKM